jgi:hypothetical protein
MVLQRTTGLPLKISVTLVEDWLQTIFFFI